MSKPIEKRPTGTLLPPFWHARQNYGRPYRPRDKPYQEDWGTVAEAFYVDVKWLIYFNFQTNDPAEVNWYLKHYVGCNKPSPSGNNWMFSNSANPGLIYIPPAEDTTLDFDPDEHCAWAPDRVKEFLRRLRLISQGLSGNKGARVKKLVQVILRVGYPRCLDLWYYNDMNITTFVDIKTSDPKLRDMTKATQGIFPFDGASGLYSQQGTWERHRGMWRIHAIRDLFDELACGAWHDPAIISWLEEIDSLMWKGWREMSLVEAKVGAGGGNAYSALVWDFLKHVTSLSKDDDHLYSAYRQ